MNSRNTQQFSAVLRASVVAVLALPLLTATAQTLYIKADNGTSLTQAAGYTNGSGIPTSADTIVFNNTLTTTRNASLGTNLSVLGINMTNPGNGTQANFTINTGNTLTIGAGGITLSNASGNSTSLLIINAGVALSSNQTWTLATGRQLQFGNNNVFSENGFKADITGGGILDWRSGTATTFSGTITGGSVFVNYVNGNLTLGSNANTFTTFSVQNGRARVGSIGNFGEASAAGSGGTSTTVTIGSSGASAYLDFTGNTTTTNRTFTRDARSSVSALNVTTAGQTLTITGAMGSGSQVNAGSAGWLFSGDGNLTLNGVISNSTGVGSTGTTVTKTGNGILTLGGANTYTGNTTLSSGTLKLGASNVIPDSSAIFLGGGTFSLNGQSDVVGALTLTGSTILDLGAGGHIEFADSHLNAWTAATNLTIAGTFNSGSSVRFGADATGLTLAQLSQISIPGYQNLSIDTNGYLAAVLAPVPEPATFALLAGLGGLAFVALRRRRA